MTTFFKTLESSASGELHSREINLEALPEYAEVSTRFEAEFPKFVREKKIQAVLEALQEELGHAIPLQMPRLVADTLSRVADDDLSEKPYIFISVNPKVMI